jgi:hypothetical protein
VHVPAPARDVPVPAQGEDDNAVQALSHGDTERNIKLCVSVIMVLRLYYIGEEHSDLDQLA